MGSNYNIKKYKIVFTIFLKKITTKAWISINLTTIHMIMLPIHRNIFLPSALITHIKSTWIIRIKICLDFTKKLPLIMIEEVN